MNNIGLQIIKSLNRGGAEVLLYNLFENPSFRSRNKLVVLSSARDMEDDFNRIGVQPLFFPIFTFGFNIIAFFRFLIFLKNEKIDYIHSHLPLAGVVSRLCKQFFDFKTFYTEHNVISLYHPVTSILNRSTYFLENKIICCSNEVYKSMPHKIRGRCVVINNAININKFKLKSSFRTWHNLGSIENPLNVICVARFRPEKRHHLFFHSLERFISNGYYIKLHFVGSGISENLLKLFNNLILKGTVVYHGELTDIKPLLSNSHVFSLLSSHEGMPISLLEAMSMGCIPVCTAVGGIKDLIDVKLQILPDTDIKVSEMFSDLLIRIIKKSEDELSNISLNSVRKIDDLYSMERMLSDLNSIYIQNNI